ncbi:uncharacterized protein B4U80_05095 [Leptotrombidium deliense]|uniref:3'-5' exonuclease domain-containing protein n=1 Tax=Leptotrombidium deliense TaxID=299467 RepID=A0A443SSN1_9ACAR|nr:uncharacterized protein B4U80_05095 [Leptotrombidium deliense]
MSRRRTDFSSHEDLDCYRHEMVLFIANILKERLTVSIDEVCDSIAKRGNLKNLKRIASGDTLEARVQVFLWQHPSIFTIGSDKEVFLTKMSADLDYELESTKEQRALDYLVFRTQQYGFMQVLMSTLFGHLQHASNDIRTYFNNNYTFFYNFLKSSENVFVILDHYVAMKNVFDTSIAEKKVLPKSDEYFIDNRVVKSTQMIVNVEDGQQIIDYIIRTKKVVAIDCEGVNLGAKNGYITLIQLAFVDGDDCVPDITPHIRVYLFDVYQRRELLPFCLKRLLQAPFVTKIFQGCSADSTSLYMKHKISLRNVFDTVIAHRYLNNGGKADLYSLYEHYVGEQANRMKRDIKKQYIGNPRLWATRPLTENLKYYAAFDVFSLIRVYFAMIPKINKEGMETITRKSNKLSVNSAHRANGGEYFSFEFVPRNDKKVYSNSRSYNHSYDHSKNWNSSGHFQNQAHFNGNCSTHEVFPSSSSHDNVPYQSRYNGYMQSTYKSNSDWNPNSYNKNGYFTTRKQFGRRYGDSSHRQSFKENFHRQ